MCASGLCTHLLSLARDWLGAVRSAERKIPRAVLLQQNLRAAHRPVARPRPVHEPEIDDFNLQRSQAHLEALERLIVAVVLAPVLRGDEDVLTLQLSLCKLGREAPVVSPVRSVGQSVSRSPVVRRARAVRGANSRSHGSLRLLVVVDERRVDGAVAKLQRVADRALRVLRVFELREACVSVSTACTSDRATLLRRARTCVPCRCRGPPTASARPPEARRSH